MLYTNLRDLFLAETFLANLETEPGTLNASSSAVLMEKDEDAVAYMIGEGGESLVAIRQGNQIVLPLAFYGGAPAHLEEGIQERLAALIEACVSLAGTETEYTVVHVDKIIEHLTERHAPRALKAIVANENLARLLRPIAPKELRIYAFNAFDENVAIGLVESKYVGTVVTDYRRRKDDPKMDDGSEWPQGSTCHAGMIILGGGAVAVTARV